MKVQYCIHYTQATSCCYLVQGPTYTKFYTYGVSKNESLKLRLLCTNLLCFYKCTNREFLQRLYDQKFYAKKVLAYCN